MAALAILVALALLYLLLVIVASRLRDPGFGPVQIACTGTGRAAGRQISVTTWNIGFAALGAQADFILDGGKDLRPLSRGEIESAAQRIAEHLASSPSDLILLQESANAGFLTRGVPVKSIIDSRLRALARAHWSDFASRFTPPPLRIDHGMTTYSRIDATRAEAVKLGPAPMIHRGFLKKYYAGLILHLPIAETGKKWVIINLHLSAFDREATHKAVQVRALFAMATAEHAKGNPVITGGDWNMRLAETDFPHAPHLRSTEWTYDFPLQVIPDGWQMVADPTIPTVRSMQQPYVRGQNDTMVIDGFVVSPDVRVVSVQTAELAFRDTDHHPVTGRFALR